MKNSILTSDVLELFDRNHIIANTLRKFVVESVADFLGDNKHDKVCGKLFDRWYQHVRRPIWVGAAQYVLQQHGFDHDEATNEAKTTLRKPVRGLRQAVSLLASPRGKEAQ